MSSALLGFFQEYKLGFAAAAYLGSKKRRAEAPA